jgi:histidine triad (HIT) family protein
VKEMKDCLFCNIIKGEQASYTLYEDDDLKVIMDAFPNSPGHTLIIPKEHYKDLDDIDIELLTKILKKAKDIKKLLEIKLNPESIILVQNNGEAEKIKHFHLHLIPTYTIVPDKTVEEMFKLITEEK